MRFLHLVLRNAWRRPGRTILTGLGVAAAIFVFAALVSLDRGVDRMIATTGNECVITVFERYKACPPYSRLPVHYRDKIASLPGLDGRVKAIMPVRFLLSNCATTTDLVAVYGVEPALFRKLRSIEVSEEQYGAFAGERGAALVGRAMAAKYRWRVGDQVTLHELQGVSFVVRGIFSAPGSALESVILVDREYLELSVHQVGVATLFWVLCDSPASVDTLSKAIDAQFANYETQTSSSSERSFISRTIDDFKDLVELAQIVAWTALILIFAAVANSVSMSVRDRLREMAVLKTLGFRRARIVRLVIAEACLVSLVSSAVGYGIAAALAQSGRFSIGVEGYTIAPDLSIEVAGLALAAGVAIALVGAYLPARRGANLSIVAGLREVD